MANVIITPNMGLPNPIPGIDTGPDYAFNLQSCINQIDQHNHAAPNGGVQINPTGINLNSALPFNGNPATGLQAAVFAQQTLPFSTLNSIFVGTDGNLYFNDGIGDASIKITSGGSVNATSSGITSGTATASFVSSITPVLVVDSAPTVPANIQGGSILLGNNVANSKFLTLSPPGSMANNFNITLPTLPTANSFMAMDQYGNITNPVAVSQGISSANIASGGVSRPNLVAVGQQIGNMTLPLFNTSSLTPVAVPGLSATITTTGRPVIIMLQPDPAYLTITGSGFSYYNGGAPGTPGTYPYIGIFKNSTQLVYFLPFGEPLYTQASGAPIVYPASLIYYVDTPAAGTYTYTVRLAVSNSAAGLYVFGSSLVAYEL